MTLRYLERMYENTRKAACQSTCLECAVVYLLEPRRSLCARMKVFGGISKALTLHRRQLRVLYALEGIWQRLTL